MIDYSKLYSRLKSEVVSYKEFQERYGSNDYCLEFIFKGLYGDVTECAECGKRFKYYRIKKLKKYACAWCGNQISPLANTIFHKSSTPLTVWLYAIYEISVAKNGISALELQRKIGTTYKTAWRIFHQVRKLLDSSGASLLEGTVEIDEAHIGRKASGQSAIIGAVDRDTHATRLEHIRTLEVSKITDFVNRNVYKEGATVYTDGNPAYTRMGLKQHASVIHGKHEYVRGSVHTGTIDGFWSQLKRSIKGTYSHVSEKYLQAYLNEFAFRRSLVGKQVFPALVSLLTRGSKSARN